MLLDLPNELIEAIVKEVTNQHDLRHLCEVCSHLYEFAAPVLYESFHVRSHTEGCPHEIVIPPLSSKNLLRYTKHLRIGPEHSDFTFKNQCIHGVYNATDPESFVEPYQEHLSKPLEPILHAIPDNCLESFAWTLGNCVPSSILGPSGHLALKQKRIESIALFTDIRCRSPYAKVTALDLSSFALLKKLSWTGMRGHFDMEMLRETLRKNANQLLELELNFMEWTSAWRYWRFAFDEFNAPDFTKALFDLPKKSIAPVFPHLQVLSLSYAELYLNEAPSFCLHTSNLRVLKLRCCRYWPALLEDIIRSGRPVELKTLEIQSVVSDSWGREDALAILSTFLASFHGLEHLALRPGELLNSPQYWDALSNHTPTLKSFIQKENEPCHLWWPPDRDYHDCDSNIYLDEVTTPFQQFMIEPKLEFLGVYCHPMLLAKILSSVRTRCSVRAIHFRQGSTSHRSTLAPWEILDRPLFLEHFDNVRGQGHDLRNFGQWAFGPDGIPSLETVIWGNFQMHGRNSLDQVFVRRKTPHDQLHGKEAKESTYDIFFNQTEQNRVIFDLKMKYLDMLEACPPPVNWTFGSTGSSL